MSSAPDEDVKELKAVVAQEHKVKPSQGHEPSQPRTGSVFDLGLNDVRTNDADPVPELVDLEGAIRSLISASEAASASPGPWGGLPVPSRSRNK